MGLVRTGRLDVTAAYSGDSGGSSFFHWSSSSSVRPTWGALCDGKFNPQVLVAMMILTGHSLGLHVIRSPTSLSQRRLTTVLRQSSIHCVRLVWEEAKYFWG